MSARTAPRTKILLVFALAAAAWVVLTVVSWVIIYLMPGPSALQAGALARPALLAESGRHR